jgi:dsRNA-specific ribonuclease
LARDGRPHVEIAHHIVAALSGHDLCASAPSWDGKWLSALLRSADFPRHTLRLRDTDDVMRETVEAILRAVIADEQLDEAVDTVITLAAVSAPGTAPVHRALPDAQEERARWLRVRDAAQARAADAGSPEQDAGSPEQ